MEPSGGGINNTARTPSTRMTGLPGRFQSCSRPTARLREYAAKENLIGDSTTLILVDEADRLRMLSLGDRDRLVLSGAARPWGAKYSRSPVSTRLAFLARVVGQFGRSSGELTSPSVKVEHQTVLGRRKAAATSNCPTTLARRLLTFSSLAAYHLKLWILPVSA